MLRTLVFVLVLCSCTNSAPRVASYRFINGNWFTGEGFEARTAQIVDGALSFSDEHALATETIDLNGAYVVPPYCEGHNHNIGGSAEGEGETVARYLADGVFYAMMPGSFKLYRDLAADQLNTPTSIDVAFGNNGLTGYGGHPRGLRESLKDRFGSYPEFTKDALADVGYFEAGSMEEVISKLALIKAENPDFLKVMLYFSDEYDLRKNDPAFYGRRGLNPALLPALVRLAHDSNLRVAVHVESDFDMRTALYAGADIIMHLPSYDSDEIVSDETISLALETNAAIVTTFTVANRYRIREPKKYARILEAQKLNLKALNDAGVRLVIGSDSVRDTSRGEARHLSDLGAISNLSLLKMWTENCSQTAFPHRKIGRLDDGYEASFLALAASPLSDFANTNNITLRVKDGQILRLQKPARSAN